MDSLAHDRGTVNSGREISEWTNDRSPRVIGIVVSIAASLIGIAGAVYEKPGLAACGFAASLMVAGMVVYCCYQSRREGRSSYVRV
jgi:hypothetical protein